MHCQGWHTDIHFPTNFTLLCCAGVQSSVCLLVSRQVAACCIVFPTLVTPVFLFEEMIAKHLILGPSITCKECFIGVCSCLSTIHLENCRMLPHRSAVRAWGKQGFSTRRSFCSFWCLSFHYWVNFLAGGIPEARNLGEERLRENNSLGNK